MKTRLLAGRRALVTGSTMGIGRAIAQELANNGASVVTHGHPSEATMLKNVGRTADLLVDLADPEGARSLIAVAGEVDILVSNVAVQHRQPLGEIDRPTASQQVDINLLAMLDLVQGVLPSMRARGWGRIVTIGSLQEVRPHPDMIVYAALKAAQANIVRNIAAQVAADGITVNNVMAGVVETERNSAALSDPPYRTSVLSRIPLARFAAPRDVAGIAVMLCLDAGGYITGASIPCDGGMSL